MPSFIFNDTLQSYSAGPGLPANFNYTLPGSSGNFINTGTQPSPTPAPGFYEKTGIIFQFIGQMGFPLNAHLGSYATGATTVWWITNGVPDTFTGSYAPGTLNLNSANPITFNVAGILQVVLESDYSVSVLVPGGRTFNSLQQVFFPFTWQIFQLVASFGEISSGGVVYITVDYSLAVNGNIVIDKASVVSGIPVSDTWNNAATINQWVFTGGGALGANTYYSELAATTSEEIIPSYPNPASTIHALTSQVMTEVAAQAITINGRASQLIVEMGRMPGNRNVRMSQIIVELITKGGFQPTGGFYVRES